MTAIQTIHSQTLDMVLKEEGKTVATVHDVISSDGKSHRGVVTNFDKGGMSNQFLEFYEKQ